MFYGIWFLDFLRHVMSNGVLVNIRITGGSNRKSFNFEKF